LLPVFRGQERETRPLFWEHEGNRAVRLGKWKLVSMYPHDWELYDTETDRTELNDLAAKDPDQVRKMSAMYDAWAARCGVVPPDKLPAALRIVPAKIAAQEDMD
jgi:arylsulfatase A-like enzyme